MANIHCPKCNAEISSLSLACPACQTPLEGKVPEARKHQDPGSFFSNFTGVLTDTRETFQWILDGPDGRHAWTMFFLIQLMKSLETVVKKREFLIPFISLFVLTAISYPMGWVAAWLLSHVGSWLGGRGDVRSLFKYVVWAGAGSLLLGICAVLGALELSSLWKTIWDVISFGVLLWTFILSLIMIAVAHRFSIWSALGTVVLTFLLVAIPLWVILTLAGLFLGIHLI